MFSSISQIFNDLNLVNLLFQYWRDSNLLIKYVKFSEDINGDLPLTCESSNKSGYLTLDYCYFNTYKLSLTYYHYVGYKIKILKADIILPIKIIDYTMKGIINNFLWLSNYMPGKKYLWIVCLDKAFKGYIMIAITHSLTLFKIFNIPFNKLSETILEYESD